MVVNQKLKLLGKKIALLSPILLLSIPLSNGVAYASSPGYAASGVLGQSSFTSTTYGSAANEFEDPNTTVIDTVHHRLFIGDLDNYRVQVYQLDNNDQIESQSASYSLGAPNPSSQGTDTIGDSSFYDGPYAMAYDAVNNRLFVEDYYRVLVFDLSGGISNNMPASYVIGQSGFNGEAGATTINTLYDPGDYGGGLAFDPTNDRLFVSDYARILVFNVAPSILQTNGNGEDASYVIGQTSFTNDNEACARNELGGSYYDENSTSLAFDDANQRLFVSDGYECSRVLVFDVAPSTLQANGNGEDASYVLGQSSFTGDTYAISQNELEAPTGIGYDPANNSLYVEDYWGYRIMVFNVSPSTISNFEDAYAVIGQPDFSTLNAGTSQTELDYTYYAAGGFAIDPSNNQLFLPDEYNYRILTYNFITVTNNSSLASATAGSSYSQTLNTANSQGTVTFAITGGSLPPGLSLNNSTGQISGTPTAAGTYTFEITAYDNNGAFGTFQDDPSYTITVSAGNSTTGSSVTAPDTGFGTPNQPNNLISLSGVSAIFTLSFGLRIFYKKK